MPFLAADTYAMETPVERLARLSSSAVALAGVERVSGYRRTTKTGRSVQVSPYERMSSETAHDILDKLEENFALPKTPEEKKAQAIVDAEANQAANLKDASDFLAAQLNAAGFAIKKKRRTEPKVGLDFKPGLMVGGQLNVPSPPPKSVEQLTVDELMAELDQYTDVTSLEQQKRLLELHAEVDRRRKKGLIRASGGVDRLVGLAGTERVSAYQRKSKRGKVVHVGTYTRSPGDMPAADILKELASKPPRSRQVALEREVASRQRAGKWSPPAAAPTPQAAPAAPAKRPSAVERMAAGLEHQEKQATKKARPGRTIRTAEAAEFFGAKPGDEITQSMLDAAEKKHGKKATDAAFFANKRTPEGPQPAPQTPEQAFGKAMEGREGLDTMLPQLIETVQKIAREAEAVRKTQEDFQRRNRERLDKENESSKANLVANRAEGKKLYDSLPDDERQNMSEEQLADEVSKAVPGAHFDKDFGEFDTTDPAGAKAQAMLEAATKAQDSEGFQSGMTKIGRAEIPKIEDKNFSTGGKAVADAKVADEARRPSFEENLRPPEGISASRWKGMTPEERKQVSSLIADGATPQEALTHLHHRRGAAWEAAGRKPLTESHAGKAEGKPVKPKGRLGRIMEKLTGELEHKNTASAEKFNERSAELRRRREIAQREQQELDGIDALRHAVVGALGEKSPKDMKDGELIENWRSGKKTGAPAEMTGAIETELRKRGLNDFEATAAKRDMEDAEFESKERVVSSIEQLVRDIQRNETGSIDIGAELGKAPPSLGKLEKLVSSSLTGGSAPRSPLKDLERKKAKR